MRKKGMSKTRCAQIGVIVAMALAFAAPALAATQLVATVGPGAEITLKQRIAIGIRSVLVLAPGRYAVVVSDRSAADDFHLIGPGISKKTSGSFVGKQTWLLRLRIGVYTFRSDAHPLKLKGTFRVR
jgi:hypothetical protein